MFCLLWASCFQFNFLKGEPPVSFLLLFTCIVIIFCSECQGACLALNAERWLKCLTEVCAYHNLPSPTEDERLPVGTGSNPVS